MKRTLKFVAVLVVLAQTSIWAVDFGTQITISDDDGVNGAGPWYQKSHEDNEVEPYAETGQQYDMEGFFLDGCKLTMVGGYNFWNYPYTMNPGDLFIGLDDVLYGDSIDVQGDKWDYGWGIYNVFGYDYVFDMHYDDNTYDLYAIDEDAILQMIDNPGFGESNPYKYYDGGSWLGEGDLTCWSTPLMDDDLEGDAAGLSGGYHYAIQFDLGVLDICGSEFIAHYTQKCGNDTLIGQGIVEDTPSNSVPDGGATALMLGMVLLAGAGYRRLSR